MVCGTFGPRSLVELGLRCPSEVPSKGIGEGAKDGWVGVGPCVVARALDDEHSSSSRAKTCQAIKVSFR